MNMVSISVITVVLNDAQAFDLTASSVVEQDLREKEWIVIDGGSVDGTVDKIKAYSDHIAFWNSGPDEGLYDAMNKGIEQAGGEWVIFLNAGDTFAGSDVLSRFLDSGISDYDVVYGEVFANYAGKKQRIRAGLEHGLWKGMVFCHQAVFVKTALMKKYTFPLKYRLGADYMVVSSLYRDGYRFFRLSFPVAVISTTGVSNRRMVLTAREHYSVAREVFRLSLLQKAYHHLFTGWVTLVEFSYRFLPAGMIRQAAILYGKMSNSVTR